MNCVLLLLLLCIVGMTETKHAGELTDADWDTDTAYSYTHVNGDYKQNPEQQQLPLVILQYFNGLL